MKRLIVSLFLVSVLCSCNTSVISFSAFELKDSQGIFSIQVKEDGTLNVKDKKVGSINKEDGTIKDQNDSIVATFNSNGDLIDKEGKVLVNINKNGEFKVDDKDLVSWSEDGELMKGSEKSGLKIEPANKNSYQAASVIVYAYLGFGK